MNVEEFRGYMCGVNEVLDGRAPNKKQWEAIMKRLKSVKALQPLAPVVSPVIIREPRPWWPQWYTWTSDSNPVIKQDGYRDNIGTIPVSTTTTNVQVTNEQAAQEVGAAEMVSLAETS